MKQTILLVSVLFSFISCTTKPTMLTGKDLQKDQILFFIKNYENGLKPQETTLSNLTEYDNEAYKNDNKVSFNQDAYTITRLYEEQNSRIMVCELHIEVAKTLEETTPSFLDKAECIELVEGQLKNIKRLATEAFSDPSGQTFGWDLGGDLNIEMVVNDKAIHFAMR
ncbi:MAG: hypothetical protein ACRBFS_12740 [Aureispira sp.]